MVQFTGKELAYLVYLTESNVKRALLDPDFSPSGHGLYKPMTALERQTRTRIKKKAQKVLLQLTIAAISGVDTSLLLPFRDDHIVTWFKLVEKDVPKIFGESPFAINEAPEVKEASPDA